MKKLIAVTMGDAAGVGPELCLRLLAHKPLHRLATPLIIGDGGLLARVAKLLHIPFNAPCFTKEPESLPKPAVFDPAEALAGIEIKPGIDQPACGRAAAQYIKVAARGCLAGRFAAMVTAPISKNALNLGGTHFPGHTEMLARLAGVRDYAMLMYSERIACAFVTSHQSMQSVPRSLTPRRVAGVAALAWRNIGALRGKTPRLCLLGLNPHAGEAGLFGSEERSILAPALRILARRGIRLDGPLPPDTAFTPAALRRYDCYIAMYHDQGCIPFKMLSFDCGVNVTLGLPFIRTSPDHGTAFDIAWHGRVSPGSFFAAFKLAARLASVA